MDEPSELYAEIERLESALRHIAEFDPFQGGHVALARANEEAMRKIACAALAGEDHVTVPIHPAA